MQVNETQSRNGTDKIKMYGWTVHDKPGVFLSVPKTDLKIDKEYQRSVGQSDAKVKRLAANWSWIACGALIVADRNGEFYVVDGQHRAMAAMKRSDISELPCLVFESAGKKEEAQAFIRANKERKPMTAIQSFNALRASGDATALKAQEMANQQGLEIKAGGGKGHIEGIGAVMKCIKADCTAFERVWPLIVEICERQPHAEIVSGVFECERRLIDASLAENKYSAKLRIAGKEEILRQIANAKVFLSAGGDKPRAIGVLNVVNHKLRKKLEMR